MYKYFFVCLLAVLSWSQLTAQGDDNQISAEDLEQLNEIEDTLALLAYAVINDSLPEHRFGTCRQLIPTLVRALKVKNSFQYPFERLKSVSIQYPRDSSFRIFTWQLYVDVNEYRYYGAIQMNTPELKLFPLVDRSANVTNLEQEILNPDKWYGSVYYNVMQVDNPEQKYYLLFGFDGYEFFRKRKVVDVLTFNQKGEPTFGAPVFIKQEEGRQPTTKNRLLLEYSAEVSIRCNYDEILNLLVFDHLVTMNGPHGEGPVQYPDGSYEAYQLQDGFWFYVNKVFNQVSETPPRPEPILDKREKDIFGKKKN